MTGNSEHTADLLRHGAIDNASKFIGYHDKVVDGIANLHEENPIL